MHSSPGVCVLERLGPTNKEIFKWDGLRCDPERVEYVRTVVRNRFDTLLGDEPAADPINVFIKAEPHKMKKIEEGRFRLISAVSLVDTLVDRVLAGWLMRTVLNTACTNPCMIGWSPVSGGWKLLDALLPGKVLCVDKQAWDWTVQEWLIESWLNVIESLAVGAAGWWRRMLRLRFKLLFRDAVFQFPDGSQAQQKCWGVMKSGCYWTILLNSLSQSLLHYVTQFQIGKSLHENEPYTMGDDTIQTYFEYIGEYLSEMAKYGPIIKEAKVTRHKEFAGFVWTQGWCCPAYYNKHLFRLHYGDLQDFLEMYQILYANDATMLTLLQQVAMELDVTLHKTTRECKVIMNGLPR